MKTVEIKGKIKLVLMKENKKYKNTLNGNLSELISMEITTKFAEPNRTRNSNDKSKKID